MQRLIAIDCDSRELCFVAATVNGDRITLEAASTETVKLPAEERPMTSEEIGKQLQALLGKQKRSGAKYLMSVDRSAIEFSEITVPPSTDAELPELVLNQLGGDSAASGEESIIDFIPLPGDQDGPQRVAAAALARHEFNRVNSVGSAAGISPERMLVRPYETAALFLSRGTTGSGHTLIVNVIADEVDLIVVDRERPLFFRTVRLPGGLGDEAAEQRLFDEVRRTLLVAPQNAEIGHVIDCVSVYGKGTAVEKLVEQIARDCSVQTEVVNPIEQFTTGSHWNNHYSGRMVPLLGMLVGEARKIHSLDFLHPRRAPKPPNRLRQGIIAGAAVAAVVGCGWFYLNEKFSDIDAKIKQLNAELADLKTQEKKSADKRKSTEALEDWVGNSVVWLDELRDLSANFPSGQDIVIQRLAMSPARGGRAGISFQGAARESKVVPRMESTLRDPRHEIQTPRVEERAQDKLYPWTFDTSISLTPEKVDFKPVEKKKSSGDDKSASDEKPADETKSSSGKKSTRDKKPSGKKGAKQTEEKSS